MQQGQKIWVRDPNIVWRSAEITAANGQVVEALDDNGQVGGCYDRTACLHTACCILSVV